MGKARVSNNIRKLRFFHDEMTQQELAEKVGVTRQTIIAMEKGHYSPSLELAFRIAFVFDSPLEEVFSYDSEDVGAYFWSSGGDCWSGGNDGG